jgi:hypothetical protein
MIRDRLSIQDTERAVRDRRQRSDFLEVHGMRERIW